MKSADISLHSRQNPPRKSDNNVTLRKSLIGSGTVCADPACGPRSCGALVRQLQGAAATCSSTPAWSNVDGAGSTVSFRRSSAAATASRRRSNCFKLARSCWSMHSSMPRLYPLRCRTCRRQFRSRLCLPTITPDISSQFLAALTIRGGPSLSPRARQHRHVGRLRPERMICVHNGRSVLLRNRCCQGHLPYHAFRDVPTLCCVI